MTKIKLIYNPNAGRQMTRRIVPNLIENLKKNNCYISEFATAKEMDAKEAASQACEDQYDIIVCLGGDGTLNEVVNGIMLNEYKPKLAIYPAGTVNDFAKYLQIPTYIEEFASMILRGNTIKSDIGLAGDRYFINVAAAGLLTDVAYKVSSEAKSVLGKYAYYFEGLREIPKQMLKPIKLKLKYGDVEEEREVLFFILANSASVGGFKFVAPDASINDGKFDLLIVDKVEIKGAAGIIVKALIGNHTNDSNLKYVQVDSLSIDCINEDVVIDLDGEEAGKLPMEFKIEKEAIEILIP